jgi:TonB family protein
MSTNGNDHPPAFEPGPIATAPKPVLARPWLVGGTLLAVLLLGLSLWLSGREARAIRHWGQRDDAQSLVAYLHRSAAAPLSSANTELAWTELARLSPDPQTVDFEDLFFRLSANPSLGPKVLTYLRDRGIGIRDHQRFVDHWFSTTEPGSHTSEAMVALFRSAPSPAWASVLISTAGLAYADGRLPEAIHRARRVADLNLDPGHPALVEALERYRSTQDGLPALASRVEDLDRSIGSTERELGRMGWQTLTAFLVDRIPALGDNVYEIATFHWTGYSLERDETAILTCSGTTFQTKGRFTMAVHPTGMKSFSRNSGGSASLPTFEEVSNQEKAEKAQAELRLMGLFAERGRASASIQDARGTLVSLNQQIKHLLRWDEPVLPYSAPGASPSVTTPAPTGNQTWHTEGQRAEEGSPGPPAPPPPTSPQTVADFDFSQMKVAYQPPSPPYPPLAKIAKIQGTVVVEVVVGPDGIPTSATAREGPPQLRPAAEAYARQWKFQPATLNGKPQYARFKLTMPFHLK